MIFDSLFDYCVTPPSSHMWPDESAARVRILSIFTNDAKNLTLLKKYQDPYFFALRKTNNISMNAHLTEIENVTDMLEEVDVSLPEEIVIYYTVKHVPKEYNICVKCF
ncbi:hypothetical protein Mp_6g08150 [Marchantia polymorpha subsp. ruderalis]|uniref:Uncharacterized protein n=2 Tax=Marchantia polymorpha TaxID=3197 RepID=A0AAF6BPS4_MARPO|nr:hypothetical protein MARPO_0060s0106 [Marchantia polymorpha]BBN14008.1 hypothetical protein Mp_6g08150 [Marchantia polymorpha subsp. ruderalis]|eukprot:PTQ37037.1 hypothetical protein MARPO_0060s0106 [Marchantia polymorpha]